jgi:hypothetical protein
MKFHDGRRRLNKTVGIGSECLTLESKLEFCFLPCEKTRFFSRCEVVFSFRDYIMKTCLKIPCQQLSRRAKNFICQQGYISHI